jgi:hypothetical protein
MRASSSEDIDGLISGPLNEINNLDDDDITQPPAAQRMMGLILRVLKG